MLNSVSLWAVDYRWWVGTWTRRLRLGHVFTSSSWEKACDLGGSDSRGGERGRLFFFVSVLTPQSRSVSNVVGLPSDHFYLMSVSIYYYEGTE